MHHYSQQYAKHVSHTVSLRRATCPTPQPQSSQYSLRYTAAPRSQHQPGLQAQPQAIHTPHDPAKGYHHGTTFTWSCTGLSPCSLRPAQDYHHVHLTMHRSVITAHVRLIMHMTVITAPCSLDHAQDCHHSTMFIWSCTGLSSQHHVHLIMHRTVITAPCSFDHAQDCHHSTMFIWSCTGLSSQHHVHLIMHRTVITAPCSLDHAQDCHHSTMFIWSCTGLSSQHHAHLIMHRTVNVAQTRPDISTAKLITSAQRTTK